MSSAPVQASARPVFIELSFAPSLPLVSHVREFVHEFYAQSLADPEALSKVELTTHELLENAVKYSVDGMAHLRVELSGAPKTLVTIRTWNRARPAHIEAARAIVESVSRAEDPVKRYQEMMLESARRTEGSGLGLGRIRAEADMSLECSVEKDVLTLIAKLWV